MKYNIQIIIIEHMYNMQTIIIKYNIQTINEFSYNVKTIIIILHNK